ncbi:S-adenosyl-L-methionine-dependent methyltransferase [Sphaerosporella brunnea]|uniref:Protein arginine methyltransferase NDUFAF7 n=1 Tax=Sphaerosporella brunnea TaxID=1250544 RepID=A0A5J5EVM5_9PEZI|nr:S-adenosyl-L-methionine-dependent methyltransferase [Sphaerosporella brunnea]
MRMRLLRHTLTRRPTTPPLRLTAPLPRCSYSSDASAPPPAPTPISLSPRAFSTPLAKQLTQAIATTGPIPLAAYMRACLTSSSGGYYTTHSDPFGRRGDFITSPEISQLFGEMLGLWVVTEWLSQGKRSSGVSLIELGPGRGTLMDDVLRTISSFQPLRSAIEHIYLVEASPTLRATQARLLCGADVSPQELPDKSAFTAKTKYGIPVTWYTELSSVPKTPSPFILAHEFFDALPIHAFEATNEGWRELLVTPVAPGEAKPAVIGGTAPEFALTRSKIATPHARLLPELSDRYKALKNRPGSIIEVSPESLTVMEDIAKRIGEQKAGASLVVDYGPLDTVPVNSLRGIKSHRMVSPFSSPGEVDVSADVDFYALAERALLASEDVEVHGPVEQGAFLSMMGIRERMQRLASGLDEEKSKDLRRGVERLAERGGGAMGKVYKVMSVVPERGGARPVGFGGQVV